MIIWALAVAKITPKIFDKYLLGGGSGKSSRYVGGNHPLYQQLEKKISLWKGFEKTIFFPTGYQANLGTLQALGTLAKKRYHFRKKAVFLIR